MDRRKLGRHDAFRPLFQDAEVGPEQPGGYRPVRLRTDRGTVACRYYPAAAGPTGRAAVWVGGVGGGWDTPANGLYPRLCGGLARDEGIASLRVSFRHPTALEEAVFDVRVGLRYLEGEGVGDAAAVIGHSFGGAAAIRAAAESLSVRTVVALATQSYGADPVSDLGPRCPILLIHGTADEVLGPYNSERVYRAAREPKEIRLLDGAGHGLDEAAAEVGRSVRDWLVARLAPEVRSHADLDQGVIT